MGSLRKSLIGVHRLVSQLRTSPISNIRAPAINNSPESAISNPLLFRYSTANFNDAGSCKIDLSNEESKRRVVNRVLYRSRQRGFLELDLVLGNWVEKNIRSMDEHGIKALVEVLDVENPDLWKWLTSQEISPEALSANPVFNAIKEQVTSNLDNHSSPETRASPGEPWVRGWDDIKKLPGSPVAGNQ